MDVTCELERDLHPRKGGSVVLAVRCASSSAKTGERPDLSIAAAIDRSASMKGSKLSAAKAAAQTLVDLLGPSDRLVLVAFDESAEILAAGPVVDRKDFKESIDRVQARSGTNISLALETCGRFLKDDGTTNVKRLLLLTDGEASKGEKTAAGLAKIAEELAKQQVATTCLGFGLDYEEDTLALIAGAGAGRLHHVDENGKLAAIYERELDRMRDLEAPWISVSVQPAENARVHGSRNSYPMKREGRGFVLELSDLRRDEERWVLFDLEVAPVPANVDDAPLVDVVVKWRDAAGESHEKRQQVVARYAADEVVANAEKNGAVVVQVALLDAAAAKMRALADADSGHFQEGSVRLMNSLARIAGSSRSYQDDRVEKEMKRLEELSEKLKAGEIDKGTRKKIRVEIYEGETPTFRRRLDLGDAPPI